MRQEDLSEDERIAALQEGLRKHRAEGRMAIGLLLLSLTLCAGLCIASFLALPAYAGALRYGAIVFGCLTAVPLQRFLAEHLPSRCPRCGTGVRAQVDTCPYCLAPLSVDSPARRSVARFRAPWWIRDRTR